jgi:hypothetical protein
MYFPKGHTILEEKVSPPRGQSVFQGEIYFTRGNKFSREGKPENV